MATGFLYLAQIKITMLGLFSKNREMVYYGISLAGLLFVLRWLELRFLIFNHRYEIYAGALAVIFMSLGIWLAVKLIKPKTIVIEKEKPQAFDFDSQACESLGISKRELEVLELMAKGMSNNEIAAELFVSLSTVKTHCARLFEKLEVSRRTQAVEKAKRLRLIA
jgi:NarL family two-component system response regulator LiaR